MGANKSLRTLIVDESASFMPAVAARMIDSVTSPLRALINYFAIIQTLLAKYVLTYLEGIKASSQVTSRNTD